MKVVWLIFASREPENIEKLMPLINKEYISFFVQFDLTQ